MVRQYKPKSDCPARLRELLDAFREMPDKPEFLEEIEESQRGSYVDLSPSDEEESPSRHRFEIVS